MVLVLLGTSLMLSSAQDRHSAGARGDARPPGNGAQVEKERNQQPTGGERETRRDGVASDIMREIEKRIRIVANELGIWWQRTRRP